MLKWIILLAVGLVTFGCALDDPSGGTALRVDSAGVEIVSSSAADRPLEWTFEPVLTLGGADAGPESFYQVPTSGLAFDPQGRIYVLDTGNSRVQVFTGTGDFIRTVGREGDGPGEFRGLSSLAVDASGTLVVHDFPGRAVMRFDSSGVYLDQRPAAPGIQGPVRVDEEAYLFATRSRTGESGDVVFDLHRAGVADTAQVARIPLPSVKPIRYESCGVGMSLPAVFDRPPRWDAREGRLALSAGPEYSVRVFEGGAEVRHVRRAIEPPAATPEHAARELGEGEAWLIGGVPCTVPTEEVVERRGIADRIPLIAALAVSPDGWIWVRREAVGEAGPVDIFDASGEYRGTLPADSPWPAAFGADDRILALDTDELGVQRVVVYRVDG